MSQENVDLVRSIYEAQARGDFSSVEWWDPEIEFEFVDGPSPGVAKGIDGMTRLWREFLSTWGELRIEPSECRQIDDEQVLALTESSGNAKRSNMPIPGEWTRGAAVYRVRGGKVVGLRIYLSQERGLADLGLAG